MSAESARDVLREAMADAWVMAAVRVRGGYDGPRPADAALDALLAHPVELLALLAEPKVCETCEDNLGREWTDDPCPSCHGTGSVKVDVLDLLAEAGLLRMVGSGRAPDAGDAKCDEWELLPTVGPSERGWEPIYVTRGEQ